MRIIQRVGLAAVIILTSGFLVCDPTWAQSSVGNEIVWKEIRGAKRKQVGKLCDLWFPSYRPSAVGKTYLDLAEEVANIDTTRCGGTLRKLVKKTECTCTEIAELFGQGSMSDMEHLLAAVRAGTLDLPSVLTGRSVRILELLRDLATSEAAILKELSLNE